MRFSFSGEIMRRRFSPQGFTLVEIMTVVALIGFLIAIAIPTFFRSRELSRKRACQENQQKMDGAKQAWALEARAPRTATPTWADLVGNTRYLRTSPRCPATGTYTINSIIENPTCSLSDQTSYPHTFDAEVNQTQ